MLIALCVSSLTLKLSKQYHAALLVLLACYKASSVVCRFFTDSRACLPIALIEETTEEMIVLSLQSHKYLVSFQNLKAVFLTKILLIDIPPQDSSLSLAPLQQHQSRHGRTSEHRHLGYRQVR